MINNLSLEIFKNSELIHIAIACCFFSLFIFKTKKSEKSIIFLITGIYSIISLWNLGSSVFPKTYWQPTKENQNIIFEIENKDLESIYAIYGVGDNNSNQNSLQVGSENINFYGSNDLKSWDFLSDLSNGSIYQYNIKNVSGSYKYIKLECNNINASLLEIAFKEKGVKNFLKTNVLDDEQNSSKYPASLLIDELEKIPHHITFYNEGYFDEVYHPRNAYEIANGQLMYANVHPLLGTSIMALFIKVFGFSPLSYRLAGAICGILILPLFYMILKLLFKNSYVRIAGTILMAVEFMHITTSRIATLEPFSVLFILLMFYFMLKYFYEKQYKKQIFYLFMCGISMGIAIATKWTAIYSSVGLAIIFFTSLLLKHIPRKKIFKTLLLCVLFFVIIPIVIYFMSYSFTILYRNEPFSIKTVIKQTLFMFNYHKNQDATHPFQSLWYHWLLNLKPIWYYYKMDTNSAVYTISCFSNPIILYSGLIALIYTFISTIKNKSISAFIISIGFLTAFLPWTIITRSLFAYHFYPSSTFMIMAICFTINQLIEKNVNYKKYVNIYLSICILIFIVYLPVICGFKTYSYYTNMLKMFKSWYF